LGTILRNRQTASSLVTFENKKVMTEGF